MITETQLPDNLDRSGRLNEALIRHGGKAITTDAIGGINLDMLIDVLSAMGVTMRTCVSDQIGLYHVVLSQPGATRDAHGAESSADGASRESAIVEATLAALLIHSPP